MNLMIRRDKLKSEYLFGPNLKYLLFFNLEMNNKFILDYVKIYQKGKVLYAFFELDFYEYEKFLTADVVSRIIRNIFWDKNKHYIVALKYGKTDLEIERNVDLVVDRASDIAIFEMDFDINFKRHFGLFGENKNELEYNLMKNLYKCYYSTTDEIGLEIFNSKIRVAVGKFISENKEYFNELLNRYPEYFIGEFTHHSCVDFCSKFLKQNKIYLLKYII